MVPLQIELLTHSVDEEHLLPCLASLAPYPRDVSLDRDVWLSSILGYEVAYLPREVRLVST